MAYRDYIHCFKCDCKLIYDGYDNIRQSLDDCYGDPNAPETGMWKITPKFLCPVCQKEHDAEYDRLLAVGKQRNEMLALLECFCDHTEAMNLITGYMPDETSLVCRARAAIARAKGEK